MDFHRKNHYVPRVYLKFWESSYKRLWTYRTLVSHKGVPLWKKSSISGIAHHEHLYTRLAKGRESDEIEKWLDLEFESPVEEILQKVIADSRLTRDDWKILVRFLAAQDVRTPARLMEFIQRWNQDLPQFLEEETDNIVKRIEKNKGDGTKLPHIKPVPHSELIPLKVGTIKQDQEHIKLKVEVVSGRGLWLFGIKRALTKTIDALHEHKWTILSPPEGMTWPTSDNPVIKLNFSGMRNYSLKGGWGVSGGNIFMPISPNHLLFTEIESRPPERGTKLEYDKAMFIRRMITENAYRMIFAKEQDKDIPKLRPRVVSLEQVENEKKQWAKFHEDQVKAEIDLNK